MSTPVTVPAPPVVAAKPTVKWGWLAVAIAVALIVAFIPTPEGLSRQAQLVLAVIAGTIVLWAHYGAAVFFETIRAGFIACFG